MLAQAAKSADEAKMDSMLGHRMRFVSFLPEWHPAARPHIVLTPGALWRQPARATVARLVP
ncbi:hypothetical protein ACFONI_05145 [Aeromonas media]|uniref:hypothetical protein n=1 Tax=Aeromonas media TaxID=651 RepID=UPI003608B6AF